MKSLASLIILCLLLAAPALSVAKIYKWVDAQGNVHYGEQPPAKNAQEMKLHKGPTPPAKSTKSDDKSDNQAKQSEGKGSFLESLAKEREEKAKADEVAAKEKARFDKNCSIARKQLASLKLGGRRYEIDEKGNRSFLDDTQIQKQQQNAQKDVAKWCK